MRIKSHLILLTSLVEMLDKGIMEVTTNHPFRIMVSYFSNKPINLLKLMYVAPGVVPSKKVTFLKEEEIDIVKKIS